MHLMLHLRTLDPGMAEAWRAVFNESEATVEVGDILDAPADAILSPANSFGFMDGGIDLLYSRYFGWELQDAVQARIRAEHGGELPVGQAIVVATGHPKFPLLVSAPTMRVPMPVDRTVHVYLAFRAALIAIDAHNRGRTDTIASLTSPALGAGIGAMPFDRVARQMRAAYADVVLRETDWRNSARGVLAQHAGLMR